MPLLMPNDTRHALDANAARCESRSLLLDRLAPCPATPAARRQVLAEVLARPADTSQREGWKNFLFEGLKLTPDDLLFGQLQARLVLNAANGMATPSGLCLDRFSGQPYIPGSAIKGCARRWALQVLRDSPEQAGKIALLTRIALAFGWTQADWANPEQSDFAWACAEQWTPVSAAVQTALWQQLGVGALTGLNWRQQLSQVAGGIQFLPAYPYVEEGFAAPVVDLELDVSTCHHPAYYAPPDRHQEPRRWQEWNLQFGKAPDSEAPEPAWFLSVAPGHLFVFTVLARQGNREVSALLEPAKAWLAEGLARFGIGAKTTAGYGWFDTSDPLQTQVRSATRQVLERRQRAAAEHAAAEAARLKREQEAADRLARESMDEAEAAYYDVEHLTDPQFLELVRRFAEQDGDFKCALLDALIDESWHADVWQQIKIWALQGNQKERRTWNPVADALRVFAKSRQVKLP